MLALGPGGSAADPTAAERQYRAARRLAADGSPDARAALAKVVDLDPQGPLADDAWIDQALLERPAHWPEDLGAIEEPAARRAVDLLSRVIDDLPSADRGAEARYYRALLLLEPLPIHDAARARVDLLAVAAPGSHPEWAASARYAAAWLLEQSGALERAADAYGRLLVDAPESLPAERARVAASRVALRSGAAGRSASLAQLAVEAAGGEAVRAATLRALALRGVAPFLETGTGTLVRRPTGVRSLGGFAAVADGVVLGDARAGSIEMWGEAGSRGRIGLGELQSIAVDPLGRLYAAAGDRLYRLLPDGSSRPIAHQGDFAPASALAADGLGRLWILDRKRARIGRVDPGSSAPVVAWTPPGARLVGLAWDGARVLTVDTRERVLLASDAAGALQPSALSTVQKPGALAADPAGRIAVLDERDDVVHLFGPDGTARARIDCRARGIVKPQAIALEPGGALALFDSSDGSWVRIP